MGQILVQFEAVFTQITGHQSQIRSKISATEAQYAQIQSSLTELDSATNAGYMAAMQQNMQKSVVMSNILVRLADFMRNSTRSVQEEERRHAQIFQQGGQS